MSTSSEKSRALDVSEKGSVHAKIVVKEATLEAQGIHIPRTGPLAALWRAVLYIDEFGVELRGIERVRPEDRSARSLADLLDAATMWLAANSTISTFSLGTLGISVFQLGLKEACLTILFFNLLSTAPVAYFAVFGPRLGLRQMTITRFSFGYYCESLSIRWAPILLLMLPSVAFFPVVLNVIACIGWSTINTIVGGQALRAVSDHNKIPESVAIIIIAILATIIALFGYRYVHLYERFAWIPVVIVLIIALGLSVEYMHSGPFSGSGEVVAANVLSFGAAVVGFGLGWSSLAADYTVNLPEDVNGHAVFWLTYAGLNLPCILIECLGAAAATVTREDFVTRYEEDGVGGLLMAMLLRADGFGRFLQVILALSIVGNKCVFLYCT